MSSTTQQIDTLKSAQRADITTALDRLHESEPRGGGGGRAHDRHVYNPPLPIHIEMTQPGGVAAIFVVRPVDLCDDGIGFLHGGYVHQGTKAMVRLVTHDGETLAVNGKVAHCRCLHGRIHFAGMQFDKPIDANLILGLDDAEQIPETPLQLFGKIDRGMLAGAMERMTWLAALPVPDADLVELLKSITALFRGEQTVLSSDVLLAHESIVVLDKEGRILAVNFSWLEFAARNGYRGSAFVGHDYMADLLKAAGVSNDAQQTLDGMRQVLSGDASGFTYAYPCASNDGKNWYQLRLELNKVGGKRTVLAIHRRLDAPLDDTCV